jgi:hypothetical protein
MYDVLQTRPGVFRLGSRSLLGFKLFSQFLCWYKVRQWCWCPPWNIIMHESISIFLLHMEWFKVDVWYVVNKTYVSSIKVKATAWVKLFKFYVINIYVWSYSLRNIHMHKRILIFISHHNEWIMCRDQDSG